MKVAVTGGTGFIGRNLVGALRARGDEVVALTRDPAKARARLGEGVECVAWSPGAPAGPWADAIGASDAVVNLAGEPIAESRWNEAVKARILESRVKGTRSVVDAMLAARAKGRGPSVLVNSSGADYYGVTTEPTDESAPPGEGFLAGVCKAWEAEAARASTGGAREVRLRTGMVLGESGGALAKMESAFKWFVGGPVGAGDQWVSWIHMQDMVGLCLDALDRDVYAGPVNAVSPNPVRMREFAAALGSAMGRPSWAPVPGFAVKLVMGEAGALALESKHVVPRAAQRAGYVFRQPDVGPALRTVMAAERRT